MIYLFYCLDIHLAWHFLLTMGPSLTSNLALTDPHLALTDPHPQYVHIFDSPHISVPDLYTSYHRHISIPHLLMW